MNEKSRLRKKTFLRMNLTIKRGQGDDSWAKRTIRVGLLALFYLEPALVNECSLEVMFVPWVTEPWLTVRLPFPECVRWQQMLSPPELTQEQDDLTLLGGDNHHLDSHHPLEWCSSDFCVSKSPVELVRNADSNERSVVGPEILPFQQVLDTPALLLRGLPLK